MNRGVSLPRLKSNSQLSKPLLQMETKRSVYSKKIFPIKEEKLQNDEQSPKNMRKEVRRAKSQIIKKQNVDTETINKNQVKYSLLQNGKLSKTTENSMISKGFSSDRTISPKVQNYDKQRIEMWKKELNELISSMLIMKKEIKSIQGATLQVKEQIKNIHQKSPQQNSQTEKKIENLRIKTENLRYDQKILKNMKDRMKNITIHYQKKTMDLKDILEKQERKIKILNQRTSVRDESINKQKMIVKMAAQNEKTINRLNELAMQQFDKKMKETEALKQVFQQNGLLKTVNEDLYRFQVYQKQAAAVFSELRANLFLQKLLDLKWNKYSQIYADTQKAEKLMKIHSLQKNSQEFDPLKIFQGSFEIKKQLQEKIKLKENQFTECTKRNSELKNQWKKVQFKEIDQQERIIEKKSMEIKSGKVQEKVLIEKHEREVIIKMRRNQEKQKKRETKMSMVKSWILKISGQIGLETKIQKTIEERLLQVINWCLKESKEQKEIILKTL